MRKSNIELTQGLLDRIRPGKDAATVLSSWGIDILRNSRPDIRLLASLLYDGFGQADFNTRDSAQKGYINKTDFLMKEVLFRYLDKVLGPEFIERSTQLFDQAEELVKQYRQVKASLESFEKKSGFAALRQGANVTIQPIAKLVNDVYLIGEAKRILRDSAGQKARELYHQPKSMIPNPDVDDYHVSKQWSRRIPALEAIGQKMDEAQEKMDLMDDQELSIRLLRSFSTTRVAEYDTEYPVYGIKTMYAYMPLVIDRLLNGWTFDNKADMDDLAVSMDDASTQLKALQARLQRMHEADCQRQVEYVADRYGDGECAVFAVALNQITDLPVVVFNVAGNSNDPGLPEGFTRHAAVQVDQDQYLDACGTSSLADICARLGCQLTVIPDPQLKTSSFELEWTTSKFDNEDIITARDHAKEMLKLRGLENLRRAEAIERWDRYAEYGM
jgi:hypothetical protein